jgi:hypothetical protein
MGFTLAKNRIMGWVFVILTVNRLVPQESSYYIEFFI